MITDKQREADPINVLRSTGLSTQVGHETARMNDVMREMRIRKYDTLPNEDPAKFQDRLDLYAQVHKPTNHLEAYFVRHAVVISWKIDRTERYARALLASWVHDAVEEAKKAHGDRVRQAMKQLLPSAKAVKQSGYEGGPALNLLDVVRGSAQGCRWLLGRWQSLQDALRKDAFWMPEFEMHAVRLSGYGSGPIREPRLLDLIVANRVLINLEFRIDSFRRLDAPVGMTIDRTAALDASVRRPRDEAEAKAVLTAHADREMAGLDAMLTDRERDGDLGVEEVDSAGWMASYEMSKEGQRLRRYQLDLNRELRETLSALTKRRAEKAKQAKACAALEKLKRRAEQCKPIHVPGANEANSSGPRPGRGPKRPARQESPRVQTFEEFLRPLMRPIEANPAAGVPVTIANDANCSAGPNTDPLIDGVHDADRPDMYREKG